MALEEQATGSTFTAIGQEILRNLVILLPPLAEQKRIVAKVDALLARVDAAREQLAKIREILKRCRLSVLAAACCGRLTEDWRAQNLKPAANPSLFANQMPRRKSAGRLWGAGVIRELSEDERGSLPTSWMWVKVRDVGKEPDDAVQVGPMSMRSRDFDDSGVPVLNVGCVQWGAFDESKLNHLSPAIAKRFDRYRIRRNDILFTRSGTVGRCAVAGEKQEGYLMTFHLLRIRTDASKCLPFYLHFVFQGAAHIRKQTEESAIGSTRAGFNTNLLAGLDIPLPPSEEQHEIVNRVTALFKLLDTIEKRVATATARAERLAQSVLAKAFRGELVSTEAELACRDGSDYEPASELLERIRAIRYDLQR